ncbi:MAG: hypothetical protein Q7S40_31835 [Opitutaceae bacterium]|nr:hypothetical protein [Opitutaceae bacterium]
MKLARRDSTREKSVDADSPSLDKHGVIDMIEMLLKCGDFGRADFNAGENVRGMLNSDQQASNIMMISGLQINGPSAMVSCALI